MNSCLYTGWVRHRRHHPRVHDFRYKLFLAYLDLDELDHIGRTVAPFSVNRWNLWSFFDRDHVDGRPGATSGKVRRLLAHHGIALDGGTIGLLTQCRVLGYVFNPISLYYCHDACGVLAAVVAEVDNTFGERYLYLLDGRPAADGCGTARFRSAKAMHVSPFLPMDCTYDFALAPVGDRLSVVIVQHEGGRRVLDARLWGRRRPLTTRTVAGALLRYPCVTLRTITAIHVEAARLYLKGIPFLRHPGETAAQRRQRALLAALAGARTVGCARQRDRLHLPRHPARTPATDTMTQAAFQCSAKSPTSSDADADSDAPAAAVGVSSNRRPACTSGVLRAANGSNASRGSGSGPSTSISDSPSRSR